MLCVYVSGVQTSHFRGCLIGSDMCQPISHLGDDGDDGDVVDGDDDDDDDGGDDNDDDDMGYPAYSHHDKIPPWWGNVNDDEGGNVSLSKTHHSPNTMMNCFLEYVYIR